MTNQEKLDKFFEFRCWKGLEEKGLANQEEYKQRLEYEIQMIQQMGFSGYFLIVADFVQWAKDQGILVGPGRGSAAGSLACYCLLITTLDPIKFDLFFERFLNPARVSMPDIDLDFDKEGRDEVIEYVSQKYGHGHVAHIGTYGLMKAKASIRDVCRVLEVPLSKTDKIANSTLPPAHGKPFSLGESIKKVDYLDSLYHSDSQEGEALRKALALENTIRNYGVHASGVVISPNPITDLLPLAKGRSDEAATQVDMNEVEELGLIKFDFLGLQTLTIVQEALRLIKENRNFDLPFYSIPLDDEETFEQLRAGSTAGIFQLESSSGMRELLIKIRPTRVQDLFALVAMYRPGPLQSDGLQHYLQVRAGQAEPYYLFNGLESILGETDGFMVYQEQIIKIATDICGWEAGEADLIRKAIGKKDEKLMASLKKKFIQGGTENNVSKSNLESLWEHIENFADYSFNKAHSACYGMISYYTAYLKTHFPQEYMCALLTCEYEKTDKVIRYITECRRLGIEILPPDVNRSNAGFTIDGDKIRFGLSAVKNLGNEPVSYITGPREEEGEFADIFDFCERVNLSKINRKKLDSLIRVGAFDFMGENRASLLATLDSIYEYRKFYKRYEKKMETYHKKVKKFDEREQQRIWAQENGHKPLSKLKVPVAPEKPEYPTLVTQSQLSFRELLEYERELLGFYVSGHPLDLCPEADHLQKLEELVDERLHKCKVYVAGTIVNLEEKQTRKGDLMAFGVLEDQTGRTELVIFPHVYSHLRDREVEGVPFAIQGTLELVKDNDDSILGTKILIDRVRELDIQEQDTSPDPIDISIPVHYIEDFTDQISDYVDKDGSQEIQLFLELDNDYSLKLSQNISVHPENLTPLLKEVEKYKVKE